MKIMKILPFFLALANATEPIKTVSCDRGADQEPILTLSRPDFKFSISSSGSQIVVRHRQMNRNIWYCQIFHQSTMVGRQNVFGQFRHRPEVEFK